MSKVDLVNKIILSERKTFLFSHPCFEMLKSFLKVLRPTHSPFNAQLLIKGINKREAFDDMNDNSHPWQYAL